MKLSRPYKIGVISVLIIFTGLMVGPFIWMFITSLKTYDETIQAPMLWFPESPQWINFSLVAAKYPFFTLYLNTLIVVIGTVISQLLFASMAAYAFARLKFPFKNTIFLGMLALLMVPSQIFLISQFNVMIKLDLTNTIEALIIPNMFTVFGVFLLRQFFAAIPMELEDAARIDGAGTFRIYWQIMIPLITPGLVALGILTMIGSWKELLWPLIVNSDMDKMTLSAGLAYLIGEHTTYYQEVMAGAVICVLPMVIIFAFFQKKFVESIAQTGIKG